jgi:hypothetical protein
VITVLESNDSKGDGKGIRTLGKQASIADERGLVDRTRG